jgi:nitrogen fixation/metabolism regulation signal transduction histidine kinase
MLLNPIFSALKQWLLHSPQLARLALAMSITGLLVAVFSLAAATGNNHVWAERYSLLLGINVTIIGILLFIVLVLLSRLLTRLKKARFGARLTLKFASAFALLGLVPGVIVYLVSALFISQSIDSWFNVKVDQALEAGLDLSRASIHTQLETLTQKTRTAAEMVVSTTGYGTEAQRIRAQFGEVDVVFFSTEGHVIASTGSLSSKGLLTDTPIGNDFQTLKRTGIFMQIESVPSSDTNDSERLNLRVAVKLPKPIVAIDSNPSMVVYLQFSQAVNPQLAHWAQTVAQGSKDYETLTLGRNGLHNIYSTTLTITMLLAVLAAIAASFVLADAMSAPLLRLARGTQAVASGDFSRLPEPTGKDDLAVLTRSFNRMLSELSGARSELTQNNTYLATVLTSLSTGVLVIDAQEQLRSINPSAQIILGLSSTLLNQKVSGLLPASVWQAITSNQGKTNWQIQTEMVSNAGETQTLLLRGAPLTQEDGTGLLLVFDDVSDVMLAQKAQAWSEVAQRLAHEIKNPLTPIQLSAERLAMKLSDKLTGSDVELLKRGTSTIVAQVTALKNMVDEFRQYARLPQAQLEPIHLNDLLSELLVLYKGKVLAMLEAKNDLVLADANQLRQIVHNLLSNALDAATSQHLHPPQVTLSTHHDAQGTRLRITDNGHGFSTESLAKLFEPYHTTKSHGTGLGLAIVQRIVQDHKAKIKVKNKINEFSGLIEGAVVDIILTTQVSS